MLFPFRSSSFFRGFADWHKTKLIKAGKSWPAKY
jgi:hypothetical protein